MSYLNHDCNLGIHKRLKGASNLAGPDGQDDSPVSAQLTLAIDGRLREDGSCVRTDREDIARRSIHDGVGDRRVETPVPVNGTNL